MLPSYKILFQVSGSIAAYKSCSLLSSLVKQGHEVQVVATESSKQFVGPATLEGLSQKPVLYDVIADGQMMKHIDLVKWANAAILCPATAHTINRLAAGLAGDLLGSLFLAWDFKKPYWVVPAMNTQMYTHPATQQSLDKLEQWGCTITPTATGVLACGDYGAGKMIEPEAIEPDFLHAISCRRLSASKPLKVLITAGGTREPIDEVRSLTNTSSGNTGADLAKQFYQRGWAVTLLRASSAVRPQGSIEQVTFTEFHDLREKLMNLLKEGSYDVVIHAAAVSDYSVTKVAGDQQELGKENAKPTKISSDQELTVNLSPNPKILNQIKRWSPQSLLIGFKLTVGANSKQVREAIDRQFDQSGADAVVHNDWLKLKELAPFHPATIYTIKGRYAEVETHAELATALIGLVNSTRTASAESKSKQPSPDGEEFHPEVKELS